MSEDVRNIFHNNLLKYMKLRSKTQSDISKDLNISLTTVSGWYHGKNFPRPDKMQLLADYLHVNVEDLIKEKDNSLNNNTKKEQAIRTIRRASDNMTDEDIDKMIDPSRYFETFAFIYPASSSFNAVYCKSS